MALESIIQKTLTDKGEFQRCPEVMTTIYLFSLLGCRGNTMSQWQTGPASKHHKTIQLVTLSFKVQLQGQGGTRHLLGIYLTAIFFTSIAKCKFPNPNESELLLPYFQQDLTSMEWSRGYHHSPLQRLHSLDLQKSKILSSFTKPETLTTVQVNNMFRCRVNLAITG